MERGKWMFEQMTFNNIMQDMMQDMPEGIDTQEGSLLYHACAKQALKLEEVYIGLEYIYEQLIYKTMDNEHLLSYAKEQEVIIKQETSAILQADFRQAIEIGTQFTRNDLNYTVIEQIEGYSYKVECETKGVIGNKGLGEIYPINYIENWLGGALVDVLIPAQSADTREEIEEKIEESFGVKPFGGNRAQYKYYFHNFNGVGAVKIKRRKKGSLYIPVTLLDSGYQIPSDTLLTEIQTAIDPEENQGEGEGYAPFGHRVKVNPAVGYVVDIKATITFQEGYTKEDLQSYIECAIEDYFLELKKTWEESTIVVRIFQIISYLSKIMGIADITEIKLNESSENIELAWDEIPLKGSVIIV